MKPWGNLNLADTDDIRSHYKAQVKMSLTGDIQAGNYLSEEVGA